MTLVNEIMILSNPPRAVPKNTMETSQELREKAAHYRRLALSITDYRTIKALREMADEYETVAAELEAASGTGRRSDVQGFS